MDDVRKLYCETPLIESLPLAKLAGIPVYMKLENSQPSSSFKQRGMSHRTLEVYKQGYKEVVSSSGGNAGLALAYCARKLDMTATIVVPNQTTADVIAKLKEQNAKVYIHGDGWDEADALALKLETETGAFYVNPFDHPTIWKGNSTMISEIARDIPSKPSVIITCVGGGGLFCGIIEGMKNVGWNDVPVVVMETSGAESFNISLQARKLVRLPKISSIATTLGALCVCSKALEYAEQHPTISKVVDDKDAVYACLKFADDHRMLVEPSCGASLSAIYKGILSKLIKQKKIKGSDGPAVIIVCGGNGVTLDLLQKWKTQFHL